MKVRVVDELNNGEKRLVDAISETTGILDAGKFIIANDDGLLDNSFLASSLNVVLFDVPCETSVYVGAAVIMQSNGVAKNALADNLENSNVIGIVQKKSVVNRCDIRVSGVTPDIFSNLDVTKEYFLSDTISGGITTTPPTITGHIKLKLGQPFSEKSFLVMKGERLVKA